MPTLPERVMELARMYHAARRAAEVLAEARRQLAKDLSRGQDQENAAVAERDRLRIELLKSLDLAAEALAGERAA